MDEGDEMQAWSVRLRSWGRRYVVGADVDVDDEVRLSLVRATAKATINANFAGAGVPLLVWAALHRRLGSGIGVWAVGLSVALVVFTAVLRNLERRAATGTFGRRESFFLVTAFGVSGAAWGAVTIAVPPDNADLGIASLVVAVVVLAASANVIFACTHFPTFLCFNVTVVATGSIGLLRNGQWEVVCLIVMAGFSALPLRAGLAGALTVAVDVSNRNQRLVEELRVANSMLEMQAMLDPVTGLANRHRFTTEAVERSSQYSEAMMAVLFIDLDNFKDVNDTYGHGAGDQLLRIVGERLATAVRGQDVLARYGGDEFVVLAEVSDVDAAMALAERLQSGVRTPVDLHDTAVPTTMSIGVATWPAGENVDMDELTRRADVALYRAKRAGRDCIRLFVSPGGIPATPGGPGVEPPADEMRLAARSPEY